jgi:hypothetical protein
MKRIFPASIVSILALLMPAAAEAHKPAHRVARTGCAVRHVAHHKAPRSCRVSRRKANVKTAVRHVSRRKATPSSKTDLLWSGAPAGTAIDNSHWSTVSAIPGHVKVVNDPLRSGKHVYRYAVSGTDQPYSGSQPRADLLSKFLLQNGGTYYISMSVFIPAGQIPPIPWTSNNWVQVFQTKNTAASMWTNALHIQEASGSATQNSFAFTGNGAGGHGPDWYSPSPVDAKWHNLTVKTRMSTSANGTIDIWWDGVKQTFRNGSGTLTNLVTMNSPTSDWLGSGWPLDIDFYRNAGNISGTPVIYHDFPKIGKTYASVAPAIASGPR